MQSDDLLFKGHIQRNVTISKKHLIIHEQQFRHEANQEEINIFFIS